MREILFSEFIFNVSGMVSLIFPRVFQTTGVSH